MLVSKLFHDYETRRGRQTKQQVSPKQDRHKGRAQRVVDIHCMGGIGLLAWGSSKLGSNVKAVYGFYVWCGSNVTDRSAEVLRW